MQILPLFWTAVSILEISCKLNVIAAVSDGASSNRMFFKMHDKTSNLDSSSTVTYRSINCYARDRYLYFFADAPHLMKTLRNAMYHSHDLGSRHLWNGSEISWNQVKRVVIDDSERGLKLLPKLSLNHVYLTSYSSMPVSYAT